MKFQKIGLKGPSAVLIELFKELSKENKNYDIGLMLTTDEERAIILLKAAKLMRERSFEIVSLMSYDVSKYWLEADADVAEAIDFCEYYAREMLDIESGYFYRVSEGGANLSGGQKQRLTIARAIKRARIMALLPFVEDYYL